jgi:hypothetical protein
VVRETPASRATSALVTRRPGVWVIETPARKPLANTIIMALRW